MANNKGIHSKAYSPIKQKELFKAFRDNLLLSYGEFAFIEATYRHDMTEVVYEVTDLETTQRYAKESRSMSFTRLGLAGWTVTV